jgi:hypothetical protein
MSGKIPTTAAAAEQPLIKHKRGMSKKSSVIILKEK